MEVGDGLEDVFCWRGTIIVEDCGFRWSGWLSGFRRGEGLWEGGCGYMYGMGVFDVYMLVAGDGREDVDGRRRTQSTNGYPWE